MVREGASNSASQMPVVVLLSPPIPRLLSCTIMSMEYPDLGQRTSSSTDSLMCLSVSITCFWDDEGADFLHSKASRHFSSKAHSR